MKNHAENVLQKLVPDPFNEQSYQKKKRGVELVMGHSSGYKFRKISLFVIYYLIKFDDKM